LIGWAAASGKLPSGAWLLFLILFVWQLPHFYAIGWMYREDYAHAGFPILPVLDPSGSRTSRHVALHIAVLLGVTGLPFVWGLAGWFYLAGAAVLGAVFLAFGLAFARRRDRESARRLFVYSVCYLPLLLGLLVLDRA
jgi:protoheme IX farnesyltransferase